MVLHGHIKNGAVVVDDPSSLPEGATVLIEVIDQKSSFWQCQSLDELVQEQGVSPIDELDELTALWPANDDANELLSYILDERAHRRETASKDDAR